eukprot:COSAG02_NODE_1169_length_14132_cov_85.570187_6_plen_1172_part_00
MCPKNPESILSNYCGDAVLEHEKVCPKNPERMLEERMLMERMAEAEYLTQATRAHDRATRELMAERLKTKKLEVAVERLKNADTCTPENQQKLVDAARDGDNEEMERLVNQRVAHPNQENSRGCFPLCIAAHHGRTDTVTTLARLGADVNLANSDDEGHTPLSSAAKQRKTETLLTLLELGADPTKANGKGATPASLLGPAGLQVALASAAQGGHAKAVEALAELGADLTATTEDGTPLLSLLGPAGLPAALAGAAKGGKMSVELVDQLASCPASCEAQDALGNLPLHIVLSQAPDDVAMKSVIERLVRAFPGGCNVKNTRNKYPLECAVERKASAELLRMLRAASGSDEAIAQALCCAIQKKYWDMVPHIKPTAVACKMKTTTGDGIQIVALELAVQNEAENSIVASLIKLLEIEKGIDTELYVDGRTCKMLLRASKLPRLRQLAETYGTFLDQYRVVGSIVHNSSTCVVIFAEDVKTNKMVALKLMHNKVEWLREKNMRKLSDGEELDHTHVMKLLVDKELEEDAGMLDSRLKGAGRYLLVMEKAQHDLNDALSHYRWAGRDREQVIEILYQVATHLEYLNEKCGRIHGDLKARNLVQMLVETEHGTKMVWMLVDLDASCKIGDIAGKKLTSTAMFPPEMARQYLEGTVNMEPLVASAQVEFWYFGCLVYQLCTLDGKTLWHADQSDNIDEEQLRQLAYQWPEYRASKLRRIVAGWPDAAHLANWLLQENPAHRPRSWGQVLQHPTFASVPGQATRKRVVMSCPEMGTLDDDEGVARMKAGADPNVVYSQEVMEKVAELQQIGFVKFGFDRAGTSTAVETEEEKKKWSKAFDGTLVVTEIGAAMRSLGLGPTEMQLQKMVDEVDTDGLKLKSDSGGEMTFLDGTIDFLDFSTMVHKVNDAFSEDDLKKTFWKFAAATPEDVKKLIFKSTDWWYGYETSVKQAVKLESQGFGGVLDIACIRGGPITRLEAQEMPRIMEQAKSDCAKSGISVKYEISHVSYHKFLLEYEPWCVEPIEQRKDRLVHSHNDSPRSTDEGASSDDGVADSAHGLVTSSVATVAEVEDLRAELEELTRKDEGHTAELAAKDRELEELYRKVKEHAAELAAKDRELEELYRKDKEHAAELAAKDRELEELYRKDKEHAAELAAKDKELGEELRAQLRTPLEGVPPT